MAVSNPETDRRLAVLAAMKGEVLQPVFTGGANAASPNGATGETYGTVLAYNGSAGLTAGSTLDDIEDRVEDIDPTIASAS